MEGKIARVREMVEASGRDIEVEVDGGIGTETIGGGRAGANVFVAGTALYAHPEGLAAAVSELRGARPKRPSGAESAAGSRDGLADAGPDPPE